VHQLTNTPDSDLYAPDPKIKATKLKNKLNKPNGSNKGKGIENAGTGGS
jgi:hypothetical protein